MGRVVHLETMEAMKLNPPFCRTCRDCCCNLANRTHVSPGAESDILKQVVRLSATYHKPLPKLVFRLGYCPAFRKEGGCIFTLDERPQQCAVYLCERAMRDLKQQAQVLGVPFQDLDYESLSLKDKLSALGL